MPETDPEILKLTVDMDKVSDVERVTLLLFVSVAEEASPVRESDSVRGRELVAVPDGEAVPESETEIDRVA